MRYICFLTIILVIFFNSLPSYPKDYSNMEIVAIEVEGIRSVKPEVIISFMEIGIGQPYSLDAIGKGIKRTYLKGIFEDISVDVIEVQGGIKLRYLIKEKTFIKGIDFIGNEQVSSRKLRDEITLKTGDEYREEKMDGMKEEIRAYYRKRGYRMLEIKIDVEKVESYRVNLLVNIHEGPPTKIKGIELKGETVFDKNEVLPLLEIKEGDIFDTEHFNNGLKKIKEFYINNGYMIAEIGPPETEYIGDEVSIKIPIEPGIMAIVNFNGNTVFLSETLLKETTIIEDGKISDEIIHDSAERIEELYRKEGYYFCRVSVVTRWSDDRGKIEIDFLINEGDRLYIKEIIFEGNKAIDSDKLETLMTISEKGFFTAGYFDDRALNKDMEEIENLYRGIGYLSAKSKGKITFDESKTEGYINITIDEGIQSRVDEIEVEGNTVFSKEEILNALRLKRGIPYNDVDLGEDRYNILSLYSRRGYIYVEVDAKRSFSEDSSKVFIKINIYEGRPVTIGKVIIRGNKDTKDKIIMRELIVRDGDIYDEESVLKSIQRVYKLGIFSHVRFEPVDPYSKIEKKDMILTVKERKAGAIELGVGYGDYDRFRGFLEISHKNLGGYNRQINLRGEGGSIEKKYALGFKEPWFLNNPIDFMANIIKEDTKSINIDTKEIRYETKRIAGIAGVEKGITDTLKASLLYEYEKVDTFNVKPGAIITREDTGTVGISSINPSIIFDTRDDPFNPSSGILTGVMFKFASRYFGSEVELYKITLQGSWYLKLWKGTILALSGRGGLGRAFGKTEGVPLIERFFLGGRTTVRGYAQDTLGPKGSDNTPTGGNTFVLLNCELRFNFLRDIGIVTFVDGGNVWLSTNPAKITRLKYTTGIGLRYETPVGPLRLDYGHKIEREPGESKGEVHFAIGHAF